MKTVPLSEVRNQFGTRTERRLELYERFEEWLTAVRSTGALRRLWFFGSFVTDKPGPGDLDMLAQFASGFDLASIAPELRPWIDHELCRSLHEIDVFLCKEDTPPSVMALLLETFGRNRAGEEAIVEVIIS